MANIKRITVKLSGFSIILSILYLVSACCGDKLSVEDIAQSAHTACAKSGSIMFDLFLCIIGLIKAYIHPSPAYLYRKHYVSG